MFSCYRPIADGAAMPGAPAALGPDDWNRLLSLSHGDKRRAFEQYAAYYLSTNGQRYWSDTHQLGVYLDGYHARLGPGSEVITEVYTLRRELPAFLAEVRRDFRAHDVDVVYGTVRLIERDDESVLAWAREPWACIIFNLHVEHTPDGIAHSADAFRRLIDLGIKHGGRYYLIAEHREDAQWVRNIRAEPRVRVRVGDRTFAATARVVPVESEPDLVRTVQGLSEKKYQWGDGLVVELELAERDR